MRVGLNAYTVRFKKLRSRDPHLIFARGGAFDAYAETNLYLQGLLNTVQKLAGHNRYPRVFRLTKHIGIDTDAVIEGLVESGTSGYDASIVDINTASVSYNKRSFEAEAPPFYFRFYYPDNQNTGLLIIQRLGVMSPKGTLFEAMRKHHASRDITFELNPVVDRTMLEKYLQGGTVAALELRAFKKRGDPRKMLKSARLGGSAIPDGTLMQVSIKPKSRLSAITESLKRTLSGSRPLSSLIMIPGLPEVDQASVTVESPTRGTKTFVITNHDGPGFAEDITDAVTLENGHPTWGSIRTHARRVMDEVVDILF